MFLDYLNHSTKACVTYKTTYCIYIVIAQSVLREETSGALKELVEANDYDSDDYDWLQTGEATNTAP